MYKLCFVGLGNPGSKYQNTRHNIGKDFLKKISIEYSLKFSKKVKFEAEISESHSGNILWVIPDNYVNQSGRTVSKILKSTNLTSENIIVCLLYTSPSPRDNTTSEIVGSVRCV